MNMFQELKIFDMGKSLARVFFKEAIEDLFKAKQIPFSYRVWAIIHGFSPTNAWFKRINNENRHLYYSDLAYYSHAPFNDSCYTKLISKGNFPYTFKDFPQYIPKYYAELHANGIKFLEAWDNAIEKEGISSIVALLKKETVIALKKSNGRAGIGFMVIRCDRDGNYSVNRTSIDSEKLFQLLSSLDGYFVCEYIHQCSAFDKIWSKTAHTLRVQTSNVKNGKAEIVFAFLRYGSTLAGEAVSHVSAPGIFTSVIDTHTGSTRITVNAGKRGQYEEVFFHPETKETFNVNVPNWNLISQQVLDMHDSIPNLRWLGWDIIVTDRGFKIIEINTFSGLNGAEVGDANPQLKEWLSFLLASKS